MLMNVLEFVVWFVGMGSEGVLGGGGGWEYSSKGSLYFNVSMSSLSGKNGNSFFMSCMLGVSLLCIMKL